MTDNTSNDRFSILDVPQAPAAQPNLSEVGAGCVTLSWYGPAYDGGSVVIGYTVQTRKVGQVQWTSLVERLVLLQDCFQLYFRVMEFALSRHLFSSISRCFRGIIYTDLFVSCNIKIFHDSEVFFLEQY